MAEPGPELTSLCAAQAAAAAAMVDHHRRTDYRGALCLAEQRWSLSDGQSHSVDVRHATYLAYAGVL